MDKEDNECLICGEELTSCYSLQFNCKHSIFLSSNFSKNLNNLFSLELKHKSNLLNAY